MKTKISSALFAFAGLLLAGTPLQLRAATITVTNTADSGAGTLRAALASANDGDTINFALAYPARIQLTSATLYVAKNVSILGPGPDRVAVDVNGNGSVFFVGPSNVVTMSGLTITNGYGGIWNYNSVLTVSNCIVTGNKVLNNFGGIFNDGRNSSSATLALINSVVSGNNASLSGGGVDNDGSFSGNAILTIMNSIIASNSVPGNKGGGIYNGASGGRAMLTVSNSMIEGNNTYYGGGIYNQCDGNNGTGVVVIVNTTLRDNSALNGGAIWNEATGGNSSVSITNSTISGDYAGAGSSGVGVSAVGGGAPELDIVGCTFSGNSGNDIYSTSWDGTSQTVFGSSTITLIGSTLVREGTALPNLALTLGTNTLQIGSTILSSDQCCRNISLTAGVAHTKNGVSSLGFNLSNDDGRNNASPNELLLTNATDQISTDPLLGPLQDNGGPTFTRAPLPGSPAIDKGKNLSGCVTDQRGWARSFDKAAIANAAGGDGTDIGAVESQSYIVVNTNDSGTGSLRQAIADSNAHPGTNTIEFDPSAYGTILLTSGELLISNNVFIAGPGATNEFVNGNASSRVFHFSNAVATVAGVTITNGFAPASPTNTPTYGGGVFNERGALTFTNCIITGNSGSKVYGGGIANVNNDASATSSVAIVNTWIRDNHTTGNGAGLFNEAYSGGANLTVLNSSIVSNSAGVLNSDGSSGAGVANFAGGASATAKLSVTNSTFSSNEAKGWGGAVYNTGSFLTGTAFLNIVNCTLNDNVGGQGGGINTEGGSHLLVANSTFSSNRISQATSGEGYQIYFYADHSVGSSTGMLVNATFTGSDDRSKHGIYVGGDVGQMQIGGTLLKHTGSGGSVYNVSGHAASLGYNLTSDTFSSGVFTNATDQINTDPMLGPLQDNGGPTFTHAPLPGSPAIDKGKNLSGSATDQRGLSRTLNLAGYPNPAGGDGTDIGAVESQDASLHLINVGVVSDQFGFNLTGPFTNVVVEASTNVSGSNWTALATNALDDAALRFSDPAAPAWPKRFYRARVQ